MGVNLLHLIGVIKRSFSILVPICPGCLDHLGIHGLELVCLPGDGILQILLGAPNSLEGPQVIVGVDGFSLGGRPEHSGYLGITLLISLGGIGQILTVRLGFSSKRLPQGFL